MNTDTPIKPTVLIAYHANCVDGFTAAWVTATAMNREDKQYKLLPMEYNEDSTSKLYVELSECEYQYLYIVDFSVSLEVLEILDTEFNTVHTTILDHHKTAFERYAPSMTVTPLSTIRIVYHGAQILLDNSHSGAAIAWNYFNPMTAQPMLVQLVEDYDLWRFNYPETKLINKYLKDQLTCNKIIDNWSGIAAFMEDEERFSFMLEAGKRLQKIHDEKVRQIVVTADPINICGYSGLAVHCPYQFTSDVGHELAKKCGTFGAMYQVELETNKVKWS